MPTKCTARILLRIAEALVTCGHEWTRGGKTEEKYNGEAVGSGIATCHEFLCHRHRDLRLPAQRTAPNWNRALREWDAQEAVQSILLAGPQDYSIGHFGEWPDEWEALEARSLILDEGQEWYFGCILERASRPPDRGIVSQLWPRWGLGRCLRQGWEY